MKKLLVSSRKGLIIYTQRNGSWQYDALHFKGIPVCLAHYDHDSNTLWSFEDHGHWGVKMHRSGDFGRNWEEVAAPKYPEGSEVAEGVPASLRYVWAAHSGQGRLWLGTVPGGLFTSSDNGESFSLNEALWSAPERPGQWFGGGMDYPGIHSIVQDPNDPDHLYIGISCAGVYETKDAGTSWQVRNEGLRADFLPDPYAKVGHDPHLLVACPASPEHMWQQNHCGIFKSSDAAATWTEVSQKDGPANFGFAVAVDEVNPDVAWVVPAISDEIRVAVDESLCVCRTDDGGKTWQDFRTGLPQQGCFDITYRHALVKSGESLLFGTTTGNLFHSSDGGESWETVSNYLPMVHALQCVEV